MPRDILLPCMDRIGRSKYDESIGMLIYWSCEEVLSSRFAPCYSPIERNSNNGNRDVKCMVCHRQHSGTLSMTIAAVVGTIFRC